MRAWSAQQPPAVPLTTDWVHEEKSVAFISYKWLGTLTTVGVGKPDALDQLVALAVEDEA